MKRKGPRVLKFGFTFFAYIMLASTKCLFYLPTESYRSMNQNWIMGNATTCDVIFINDTDIFAYKYFHNSIQTNFDHLQVSFVNPLLSKRMADIVNGKKRRFWSIDSSHCQVDDFVSDDVIVCNRNYAKAIIQLTKLFHTKQAALISSANICQNITANEILKSFNSQNGRHGIQNITHYETQEIHNPVKLRRMFYDLKSREVSVVILLVNKVASDLIFEMAENYGMTSYDTVWLTVEYSHYLKLGKDNIPWQVIDFHQSKHASWQSDILEETIKAIASFINENNVTNTINNSSIETALTKKLKRNLYQINCINEQHKIDIFARNITLMPLLAWTKVFSWSNNHELKMYAEASLLVRMIRTPSKSIRLKVVTVMDSPFTIHANHLFNGKTCDHGVLCKRSVLGLSESDPEKWEPTCCIGFLMDLLTLVSNDLQFIPDVYIVEDGYYGGKDKSTGIWNGLVQDVLLEKADIAVAALTPTADRSKVVDFCEPYMRVDLVVMISTLNNKLSFINWEFLSPLSHDLRIWILCTFIIGTVLIYILENQHLVLKRITDKSVHADYPWREGFSYFSGLTFQRDLGGKNPRRPGARVTAVAFAFGMVIIMTTYTAVLTASKVSQESKNPFFGFKDDRIRHPSSEFKYATVAHTSIESYFKNSDDEVHQRMYQFMLNYNVNKTTEGIELVQRGNLKAFIHESPLLAYHMSKQSECNLKIYGEPIPQGGYAFSVPKNSQWKHLISQSVLKYKEKETVNEIYKKWFPTSCSQNASATLTYSEVEINYFGGLIFLLCVCLLLTVALLGVEHFCHRHHRRVINPIQDKVLVWRETKAAGRRNALIDPNDISKLQKLQQKQAEEGGDSDSSSDSVISEGEEELIRMRMASMRRGSRSVNMSTNHSVKSSDDSMNSVSLFRSKQSGSVGNFALRSRRALHSTVEVSENESSESEESPFRELESEHKPKDYIIRIDHGLSSDCDSNLERSVTGENISMTSTLSKEDENVDKAYFENIDDDNSKVEAIVNTDPSRCRNNDNEINNDRNSNNENENEINNDRNSNNDKENEINNDRNSNNQNENEINNDRSSNDDNENEINNDRNSNNENENEINNDRNSNDDNENEINNEIDNDRNNNDDDDDDENKNNNDGNRNEDKVKNNSKNDNKNDEDKQDNNNSDSSSDNVKSNDDGNKKNNEDVNNKCNDSNDENKINGCTHHKRSNCSIDGDVGKINSSSNDVTNINGDGGGVDDANSVDIKEKKTVQNMESKEDIILNPVQITTSENTGKVLNNNKATLPNGILHINMDVGSEEI